jgi:hypothetical protein
MDSDITGPIGPYSYDTGQNLDFLNNNDVYLNHIMSIVQNKNSVGLPTNAIPPFQNSIAGGFFILHKDNINWWFNTFDNKLHLYFQHNYIVKDDQIIIADCVFSNLENFSLFRECDQPYDNWFMFQRILN